MTTHPITMNAGAAIEEVGHDHVPRLEAGGVLESLGGGPQIEVGAAHSEQCYQVVDELVREIRRVRDAADSGGNRPVVHETMDRPAHRIGECRDTHAVRFILVGPREVDLLLSGRSLGDGEGALYGIAAAARGGNDNSAEHHRSRQNALSRICMDCPSDMSLRDVRDLVREHAGEFVFIAARVEQAGMHAAQIIVDWLKRAYSSTSLDVDQAT